MYKSSMGFGTYKNMKSGANAISTVSTISYCRSEYMSQPNLFGLSRACFRYGKGIWIAKSSNSPPITIEFSRDVQATS